MQRYMGSILLRCCLGLAMCGSARAQESSIQVRTPPIHFSVVSIRPSTPQVRSVYKPLPDGITGQSMSTMFLLQTAYGIALDSFVFGAPDWVRREQYDITAKVSEADIAAYGSLKPAEQNALLRDVLKERFALSLHTESRTFPEYALVVKKGGPKPEALRPTVGEAQQPQWRITARYQLDAKNISMPDLCNMLLSTEARELVRDSTGLSGNYDFQLRWSRENPDGSASTTSDAPEIFTAVQEQLGLQIVPRRIAETVFIVEHIDKPSAN